jgi:homoserine O-acetyltransferase
MPKKDLGIQKSTEEIHHNEGNKFRLHLEGKTPIDKSDDEFNVFSAQSYLRYQGDKFVNRYDTLMRFDANCYISITRKMDTHDISRGRGEYSDVLKSIEQPTLVIGIQTDGLFTVEEQYELGECIPNSQVVIIESGEGMLI